MSDFDVRKLLEELDASKEKFAPAASQARMEAEPNLASATARYKPSVGLSRPRTLYYRTIQIVERYPCPQCGTVLRNEHVPYVVNVDLGGREPESLVMTGSFGYFCPSCPTTAVNPEGVKRELLNAKMIPSKGTVFIVVGVLDLAAVSPSQRNLPLNRLHPMPLVPFKSPIAKKSKQTGKDGSKKKHKRKRR